MNKLVKTLAALMIVSAAVITVGCTPENETDNEPDNGFVIPNNPVSSVKRLSKVTWVYDEGEYSNNQTFTQVINYTWKGDLITNIDAYDEGELVYTVAFTYDGKKVSEVDVREGNYHFIYKFSYTGNHVTHVDEFDDSIKMSVVDFIYDVAGNMTRADFNNGNFVFNMAWEGGDLVTKDLEYEGTSSYQYDTKKNPYSGDLAWNMVFMEEGFQYLSAHNVVRKQWTPLSGNNVNVTNYEYTYDGDYPLTCSYSSQYGSGTYYFEYVK